MENLNELVEVALEARRQFFGEPVDVPCYRQELEFIIPRIIEEYNVLRRIKIALHSARIVERLRELEGEIAKTDSGIDRGLNDRNPSWHKGNDPWGQHPV